MRIIPVLDLKGGQVVRGIAGRRQEYRRVVSRLTTSAEPLDVAEAFRSHFGLEELYLADLDAIAGAAPALDIYTALQANGFRLWVDAGLRDSGDAEPLVAAGITVIVAGLETLAAPAALAMLCGVLGSQRIAFSLDLKEGRPLAASAAWDAADVRAVVEQAVVCGVGRLIVLDLARVGVSSGTGTEELCAELAAAYPAVQIFAGGGVRDPGDLRRMKVRGVSGALVASALHDGHLSRDDLRAL